MKNILKTGAIVVTLVIAQPLFANAESIRSGSEGNTSVSSKMLNRLEEIRTMDKSNLSTHQKRELRRELRATKRAMAPVPPSGGGGVYISVGAIIIILLLIIILL